MRFIELATVSEQVAATARRGEKTSLLAGLLRSLTPDEAAIAVGLLTGQPRQGRIGVGWSALSKLHVGDADEPSLEVLDVDRWLTELAAQSGPGSTGRRRSLLEAVFSRATAVEQRLLWGVFSGELRQGALDGVMVEAIARGAGVPVEEVRRAHMFSGDLGETARQAFSGGVDALRTVTLVPGRAVGPMLASPAEGVAEALAETGEASVEWKLDGARVQAHRQAGEVRLFTRNLNEVAARLPGVVSLVAGLAGGDLVLDGEVAGMTDEGGLRRFQDMMGDFSAQAAAGRGGGLGAYFFDVLHAGGIALVDDPLAARRTVLEDLVPAPFRLPSIVTADPAEATEFMDDAVRRGLEGVMIKDLASPYAAGRRGGSWRKVKPVHTFDLVVLAVEWGHGRRRGWLSNLHLGARSDDGFVMVGKTFKGMTDELLRWQTEELQKIAIATGREGAEHVVHVRPEKVVEVAIDGVQRSPRYPGGVALRFARVRRYRPDKTAAEADRIESLQALL
jgi:DNA ligase 1